MSTPKAPAVYIVTSKPRGTLYIGVTSNLIKRIWQHREGISDGFTRRHGVKTLVWYEQHQNMATAIEREKAMKIWPRQRKIDLITKANPQWHDHWADIAGATTVSARAFLTPASRE